MGKYASYQIKRPERPWKIHPVWRGIGCAMSILVPILSYAGAVLVVRANFQNRWLAVPAEIAGWINFAPVYQYVPVLRSFLLSLGRIYYLDIILAVLFIMVAFGLLTVVYSMLYRITGVPRYGPTDSPPIRKSPRKGLGKTR
jgi:hypothetical protein